MARVEYDELEVGDAQVTKLNATMTAIAAQTTNLDEDNFAEEGLDYRAFASQAASRKAFAPVEVSTLASEALTTTWETIDFGTAMQSPGTITLAANERLEVNFMISYDTSGATPGIPINGDIEHRWRWQEQGGAAAVVGTARHLNPRATSAPSPLDAIGNPVTIDGASARLWMKLVLDGPKTIDWVEVQFRDSSTNDVTVQSRCQALWGTIYSRVTV